MLSTWIVLGYLNTCGEQFGEQSTRRGEITTLRSTASFLQHFHCRCYLLRFSLLLFGFLLAALCISLLPWQRPWHQGGRGGAAPRHTSPPPSSVPVRSRVATMHTQVQHPWYSLRLSPMRVPYVLPRSPSPAGPHADTIRTRLQDPSQPHARLHTTHLLRGRSGELESSLTCLLPPPPPPLYGTEFGHGRADPAAPADRQARSPYGKYPTREHSPFDKETPAHVYLPSSAPQASSAVHCATPGWVVAPPPHYHNQPPPQMVSSPDPRPVLVIEYTGAGNAVNLPPKDLPIDNMAEEVKLTRNMVSIRITGCG